MELIQILRTIYVFNNSKFAILKEKTAKDLVITFNSLNFDELNAFLQENNYELKVP